jgi:hypothetical protein
MNPYPGIRQRQENLALICEEQLNGEWHEFWRTDTMGNDYAFTDANNKCKLRHFARTQLFGKQVVLENVLADLGALEHLVQKRQPDFKLKSLRELQEWIDARKQ